MQPGTVIKGRFQVETLVGQGGVGAVYLAHDEAGERVAVKCLRRDRRTSSRRFDREVELLMDLEHPAIVRCLDTHVGDAGERYLIMEWLDGVDLAKRLREGPLEVAETLALGRRIADALHHAHQRGIVHRDVKPGNIFLPHGRMDEAKLLDFGAARWNAGVTLTATNAQIGTPAYMAPEQVRGEPGVGPAADIFSLGCVLYECLTGQSAFAGGQIMAIFYKILMAEPPRVSEYVHGVPADVEELVASMLAKVPDERLTSGPALLARFDELLVHADTEESQVSVLDERDALTSDERRMVSAVMVAGSMSFDAWLESRAHVLDDMEEAMPPVVDETLAEEAHLDRIQSRFEAIGGRFEQLGDGSLLVGFDARGAATDRALHAARCALALRSEYPGQPMVVATGRAIVARSRVLGEVIERAIEICKRERSQGESDAIRVDATTADLIDGRFSLARDEHGALLIAELDEEGERGQRGAGHSATFMGRVTPFVGRGKEHAMLVASLAQCLEDGEAQAVIVTGAAGVGKSRLRREFGEYIRDQGEDIKLWRARGDAMRAGSSLAAIAQIIRGLAGIREDESADLRREKLLARVRRSVAPDDAERVALFLGEIVDTRWSEDDHVQLAAARRDAQLMSDQLRRAFEDLVEAETRTSTVVIELDDLHWSDRATVAMLDHVLRRLHDRSLLVLAYGREQVRTIFPNLWAERGATEVRVGALSRRAAERLVRAVVGDGFSYDEIARLLERGQGNPLFLEELMRSAAAGRDSSDTVLAMLEVRLQSLAPDERRVLRAASVFGDHFCRGGVAALVGAQGPIDGAFQVLLHEELFVQHDSSRFAGEAEYSFRHDLVREAAYQMLTDEDRRLGHRLAGEWVQDKGEADALVLAEHFERAGLGERAVPFFLRAAQNALEANDLDGAVELAERGVGHGAVRETLGALRAVQSSAYVWRGEYDLAIACCEGAMIRLPEGGRAWYEVAEHLVHAQVTLDRIAPIARLAESLQTGPLPGHDRQGWSVLSSLVSGCLVVYGPSETGLALLDRVVAEHSGDADMAPRVAGSLHVTQGIRASVIAGNVCAALRHHREAARQFEMAGNLRAAVMYEGCVGGYESELGLYEHAQEILTRARERAQALAIPRLVELMDLRLGWILHCLDRSDEALTTLLPCALLMEERGEYRMASACWNYLARIDVGLKSLDRAEADARSALRLGVDIPGTKAYALATLAHVLLARSRPDEAMLAADEAMALFEELGGVEEGEALIRLVFAEALYASGRGAEARAAIRDARDHLLAHASEIDEPSWRSSFLAKVPQNARTLELAERWSS